jgi:hypothetical protein
VGALLQSLSELIEVVKAKRGDAAQPFKVGSPLALAVGSGSLVDWFLKRWARHAGAPDLAATAEHDLGPDLSLIDF